MPAVYFDFSDRTAFVTGSSRNLGFGIVKGFLDSGARVVVHGSTQESVNQAGEALKEHYAESRVFLLPCDLSSPEAVEAAYTILREERWLPDILVNNAAHQGLGTSGLLEQDEAFFRDVLEVNLVSTLRLSRLAAEDMKENGGGAIVNISSVAGLRSLTGRSAYSVSKAAINGLTRSMAIELAPLGISVNEISPGYVWTERWNTLDRDIECYRRATIPSGNPSNSEEIAATVLFLASGAAPSLVGANIVMDSGFDAEWLPPDAFFHRQSHCARTL